MSVSNHRHSALYFLNQEFQGHTTDLKHTFAELQHINSVSKQMKPDVRPKMDTYEYAAYHDSSKLQPSVSPPVESRTGDMVSPANIENTDISNLHINKTGEEFKRGIKRPLSELSNDRDTSNMSSPLSCDSEESRSRKRTPPNQSLEEIMQARELANDRERNRTMNLNDGFKKLRDRIPTLPSDKLSKIQTLKLAIRYIEFLYELKDSPPRTDPVFGSDCSRTVYDSLHCLFNVSRVEGAWGGNL